MRHQILSLHSFLFLLAVLAAPKAGALLVLALATEMPAWPMVIGIAGAGAIAALIAHQGADRV